MKGKRKVDQCRKRLMRVGAVLVLILWLVGTQGTPVQALVAADFAGNPTTGCAPLGVSFSDSSSGGVLSYLWKFGDGTPDTTVRNPSHTYTAPGTYTVSLTVSDTSGSDTETKIGYITVAPPVAANFTVNNQTPCSGTSVQFTANCTGTVNSYVWTFGDGDFSTDSNPSHTYRTTDSCAVTLVITGSCGMDIETKSSYINPVAFPVANFTVNNQTPCSGTTVNFTAQCTGTINSYFWNFGDGGTSSDSNPSHTYRTIGAHTVTLAVTGPCGTDIETKSSYINPVTSPEANFTVNNQTPCSGTSVQFTANCTGTINSYFWNFGDVGISSDSNPSHTYRTTGPCTVTLAVSGPCGTDTETKVAYINNPADSIQADFIADNTAPCSGTSVQFTANCTGSVDTYSWSFGDGGTSSDSNPSHTYRTTNPCTVTLSVTGDCGTDIDTETKIAYINPVALPVANFTANNQTPCSGTTVNFTAQCTGTVNSYSWDFGDGGTSSDSNPVHTYRTSDPRTVTLAVAGACGMDIETKIAYINPVVLPVANFTANNQTPCSGTTVHFTAQCTGTVNTYLWNFGDGQTSADPNPSHTYRTTGSCTVALAVVGACGTDTKTKTGYITVSGSTLSADFFATATVGYAPLTVNFNDSSTGDILSRLWSFGTGDTSTVRSPTHIYARPGTYTVFLTVSDSWGCDTETKTGYITVNGSTLSADFLAAPTTGCAPLRVNFSDSSTGNVLSWFWNFGDGDTATVRNPGHLYTGPGTYIVSLVVSDTWGSDIKTEYLIVDYCPTQWQGVTSPTSQNLRSVSMVSQTDGWAVGFFGTLLRYNGSSWTKLSSSPTSERLYSVAMVSATDGWAVGNWGTILRYNGSSWSKVSPSPTTRDLRSVAMASPTNGWAVGFSGAIFHYDGSSWSPFSSPTTNNLYSVTTTSDTKAWAMGANGTILHYDGSSWSQVGSPTTQALYSVAMAGPTNGWAVGDSGTILHCDGSSCTGVSSPTTNNLYSVTTTSDTKAWAMGANGTILHYDGSSWSQVGSPTTQALYSVAMAGPTNGWAVGDNGVILQFGSDTTPPTAFNLLSPANGSEIDTPLPIFSWQNSSDLESGIGVYQLWIDGVKERDVAGTSTTPVRSLSVGLHSWYVVAKNGAGLGTQSTSTYSVTITGEPNSISGEVAYTGSETGTIYVQASTTSTFDSIIAEAIAASPYTLTNLTPDTYYVRAFMDTDADHTFGSGPETGEPQGQYPGLVKLVSNQAISNIDLVISDAVLSVSPVTKAVSVGDSFTLDIYLSNAPEFDSLGTYLSFDTNVLEVIGLTQGPFPVGVSVIISDSDNQTGQINYAAGLTSGTTQGSGVVLTITFKARAEGSSSLVFDDTAPRNTQILNGKIPVFLTTTYGEATVTENGSLDGYVNFDLPRQNNHLDIEVAIEGTTLKDTTDTDGYFLIENVPIDTYSVTAYAPGASPKGWEDVVISKSTKTTADTLTLLNADANGDYMVSLIDFGYLKTAFLKTSSDTGWEDSGYHTRDGYINSDFNGDAMVSLLDFGYLKLNFLKTCGNPSGAPPFGAPPLVAAKALSPSARSSGNGLATLMITPQTKQVNVGETFTLDIYLANAPGFDSLGTYLSFDINVLEVTGLVQGPFPVGASVIISNHNNQTGQINYAAGLISGTTQDSGTVLTITFRAKAKGSSGVNFDSAPPRNTEILNGITPVPFTTQNGIITVGSSCPTANAGSDVSVCSGTCTNLNGQASGGTPPYTYSWSPTTGLDNPNTANPSACSDTTTIYTLTVNDNNGCTDNDQVIITVNPCDTSCAVTVSIPETTASPGGTVEIPVMTTGLTGLAVYSIEMTLLIADTSCLVPTQILSQGSLVEGWGNPIYNIQGGEIVVTIAGLNPLNGEGPLLFIRCQVPLTASGNDTSSIKFERFLFNEGSPSVYSQDGVFRIGAGYDIAGRVGYFSNDDSINEVSLSLNGSDSLAAKTDELGEYKFSNVGPGNYTLTPIHTGNTNNAITAFDASMILRYGVGLLDLAPYQLIAADVSGNGEVTAFDASYILRYGVKLIDEFPVGKEWRFVPTGFPIDETNWASAPETIAYTPLSTDMPDQDFVGIVYGDVSGNWTNGSKTMAMKTMAIKAGLSPNIDVSISDASVEQGTSVMIPVYVSDLSGLDIWAFEIKLSYDTTVLTAATVTTANSLSSTWGSPIYNIVDGWIGISMAGAAPLSGSGDLIFITFDAIGAPGSSAALHFERMLFNEGDPAAVTTDGLVQITVNSSTVSANFSATTTAGCAPLTVHFSDSSTGDVISYLWDFGDGDTGSVQNPTHTYTSSGTYTVSLTVSDTCDSDSEVKAGYITVTGQSAPAPGLGEVLVYPNPFKRYEHSFIKFGHPPDQRLPQEATIKIYAITGELVKEIEVTPSDRGQVKWDGNNQAGRPLASGIYIYHINSKDKSITGQVGIIK